MAIYSDFLSIPLPFGGACNGGDNAGHRAPATVIVLAEHACQPQETLTIGKERDGKIPLVVKADSVRFPGITLHLDVWLHSRRCGKDVRWNGIRKSMV